MRFVLLQVFNGHQRSFLVVLCFFAALFFLEKYPQHWQQHIQLIEQMVLISNITVALFASYFNRSRLTVAIFLLVVYYLRPMASVHDVAIFYQNTEWLLLFLSSSLTLLAFSKERNLLSIHGIKRLILIILLAIISHFWLIYYDHVLPTLRDIPFIALTLPYMKLDIPIWGCAILILWRLLTEKSLVVSALTLIFAVWILHHYQITHLPLSLQLSLIALLCFMVVLLDSYFLAYRDELTQLPSRRALSQLSLSLGRNYTLAMLDIDHFKKFNDTYGHDIGDQVLKLVAAKLAKVSAGGKVFRYGGEEFTIVFPRKSVEAVLPALEEVRCALQDYAIAIRQPVRTNKQHRRKGHKASTTKTVRVTISIGVAAKENKQGFEQVLKSADQALYRAKKSGRNNVSQ